MLHTSPETLPVLQILNKWNNGILEEYNNYVSTVNEFIPADKFPPTRHKADGKGRHLDIWHLEHKNRKLYLDYFPSVSKIIEETNQDPDLELTSVYVATADGKCKIHLHTDDDSEFIKVQNEESKLKGKTARQYRAHIPLIIPEDCFFYHMDKTLTKIKWTLNNCFAFEKFDKHYVINNADHPYRVVVLCDFLMAAHV
jgi:hypothetical protein